MIKMSKLIEFLLGSILIAVSTIALVFFSTLHYILRVGDFSQCAWHSVAKAWVDSNGDGRIDPHESPLSNVTIHIDDAQNDLIDVGWPAVTNSEGVVQLNASIPNCSNSLLEIYADGPKGFRATTRARLEIHRDFWGNPETGTTYYFGFRVAK